MSAMRNNSKWKCKNRYSSQLEMHPADLEPSLDTVEVRSSSLLVPTISFKHLELILIPPPCTLMHSPVISVTQQCTVDESARPRLFTVPKPRSQHLAYSLVNNRGEVRLGALRK